MEYFHLTTPQQNIWNLQQYYQNTSIANLCGAVFYKEKRDSGFLKQAIHQFIRNQSGMRLRFCDDGEVRQYVAEYGEDEIPVMKFSDREEFDRFADAFAKEPMGTVYCALYRFVVFHIENISGILVALSHLIADAWTFGLLANQLDEAYQILAGQKEGELIQGDYRDYIHSWEDYLSSERYEMDRKYWEETYHARPEKTTVKQYPASLDSVQAKRTVRMLPVALEKKMGAYCKERAVTPAVLFETALILYLSKINQENSSVTIGVPVLNRRNAREKRIAGMFVSTMPLTVTLEAAMTVSELEKHIARVHVELFRHQKYPYAEILKSLREKQNFSGNLYDVMISYQNAKTHSGSNTKWYTNGCSEVPLVIHIDNRDESDSHTVNVDYQTAVFAEEEVEWILNRLEFILEQIVEDDTKSVRDICVVPQKEFEKTVYEFNDTYVEYPREKCVHELFCEQVQRTPDRIALVFEEMKFTYRKLDEMSNSLAYFLREKGVRPNDVVPTIARRSWHVVVAMLGILKAGGAYMPVSPDYPEDRIASMIENAKSRIALVYGYEKKVKVESVQLENFDYTCHKSEINSVNSSEDIAYVIFTSGSTGQPKGISVCHYNVCNYAHNNNNNNVCHKIIKNQYDSIVSVTNIIFDIFVTESLLPLINGLCIYFVSEDEAISQDRLGRLVEQNSIEVIQTTPTKMRGYILNENNVGYLRRMKAVILGGEAFPQDLYSKLKSYTDAQIFNIYGPAETTVWSTNVQIRDDDITIGKPVANTQIYILGQDNTPCPIGVAGELCIAGDGVGKGYLNQPELTAERFVPNPFATETNRHGRVMYRTGDLACWREDGEIEYLGRIDTQVKIRGLRIELGEIESVMGSMENIGLVAVAAKRDPEGRQYLAGYYTAETDIDEKELRNHLSQKLPKYMVPNYFVHLSEMPMTGSGKIDRKSLPEPDFALQKQEYLAPVTETQKKLCGLLEEMFHMERVGIRDDFFELGGDSLGAMQYMAQAHGMGINFALQNVFDYPTVQSLCEFMERGSGKKVCYESSDFEKYESLLKANKIEESFVPEKKSLGNVFLTGATGFLGAHVLDALMREERGKIYCLIRGATEEEGRKRFLDILQYYFGNRYEGDLYRRIIPVMGDVEKEPVGKNLPADVQTVIHTAASVRHYGSYDYFYRMNADGTRRIAEYAASLQAKLIHISTLSVSGNSMADEFTAYRSEEEKYFYETSFYIGQPLDNVYIHSKFEAEKEVYDAMLQGLDAKVIRVGNLTNRASDYRFQPNYRENAFLTRVKAILEFGLFPDYLMPLYAEFSPVDLTAEGIVKIAQYADRQNVFHLNSNRPIYFDRFLAIARELGVSMDVVDGGVFHEALEKTIKDAGMEYIFKALQNDMDGQGRLVYDSNIHIVNDFTVWFLKKLGFEWNPVDLEYIKGYMEYFREIGYLNV